MTSHSLSVELYYGAAWHDVAAAGEVYRDVIASTTRYGAHTFARWNPGTTKVSLDNEDGKYNPQNPMSSVYGSIGRNTPMRIGMDGDIVWYGEAANWAPSRSVSKIRRTQLTGGGILRRLGIGKAPIISALSVAIIALDPIIYLPLYDGKLTTGIVTSQSSSTPTSQPTAVDGVVGFGQITGPPGDTRNAPELVSDSDTPPNVTVNVPGDTGDSWIVDFGIRLVRTGTYSVVLPLGITTKDGSGQVTIVWTDGGAQLITASVSSVTTDLVATYNTNLFDEQWHQIRLKVAQSGGTCTLTVYVDGTSVASDSDTLSPGAVESLTLVGQSSGFAKSCSIAHLGVYSGTSAASTYSAFTGYAGEKSYTRFARLCTERGITSTTLYEDTKYWNTRAMGAQPVGTFLDTLYDVVVTDGGIAYEKQDGSGLVFKTFSYLQRQTPIEIDIDTDIVPPLMTDVGDRDTRNSITVEVPNKITAYFKKTSGPLSIQEPPDGVGEYETKVTASAYTLGDPEQIAAWVGALGTVEGVHYSEITLDFDANPSLDITGLDIGTTIQLNNVPVYDDPETPLLLVTAISHTTDRFRRTANLTVVSAKPYQTGGMDYEGLMDCKASTLSGDLSTSATSIGLDIADLCVWGHADGNYIVVIGGETMNCTAVGSPSGTPGAYTQTLTVTRSANGVVKTHSTGDEVHVVDSFILVP